MTEENAIVKEGLGMDRSAKPGVFRGGFPGMGRKQMGLGGQGAGEVFSGLRFRPETEEPPAPIWTKECIAQTIPMGRFLPE